jgi:predicted ATPase with chaperone activity
MAAVDCDLRAGKSILARRLPTMVPAMTLAEALDTTCIHRVAGLTGERTAVITTRPCHAGLCYSMAMSTGDSSYGFAVRGGALIHTISRTS